MVQLAHLRAQRHGQQHRHSSRGKRNPGFALGLRRAILMPRNRITGAWKNRIVSSAANCLNQLFGRGRCWVEDHVGAMRNQIHVRGFHSSGRAQRLFHVMLTRGARHPQHRQRERFSGVGRHLLFLMCCVAGLGKRGNR